MQPLFEDLEETASVEGSVRPRVRRKQKTGLFGLNPVLSVIFVGALVLVIVLTLILGLKGCAPKPSIEGRWNLDGATIYEFYPEGKGALVLTTMTFEFNYTVDGDKVSIDFVDERATDAKYEFAVTEDLLMLIGGPGTTQTQHILKRDN